LTLVDGSWRQRAGGSTGDLGASLQALSKRLAGRGRSAPSGVTEADQSEGALDLADLLSMPLDRFAREGQLVEVRVPWLDVTLWFVPEGRDAETLGRQGVNRGRVWTARELRGVLAIAGRTREALRTIALAKLTVNGDVTEVRWKGR
jgi:hypothetical protein